MDSNQIIFLNGASSSGKSSIAKVLQNHLEKPYLNISEDMFFDTLPARNYSQDEYFRYGLRLYNGFTHCVRTLAEYGNKVIVDTVAWNPGSLDGFVKSLWKMSVFSIGLHCPLSLLEIREKQRSNRSLGLARKQFEAAHHNALYDFEIDTSQNDNNACAKLIIQALKNPPTPHAFAKMKQVFRDE